MNNFIIVIGGPAEGFEYIGPFASFKAADDYCVEYYNAPEACAWIVDLTPPEK